MIFYASVMSVKSIFSAASIGMLREWEWRNGLRAAIGWERAPEGRWVLNGAEILKRQYSNWTAANINSLASFSLSAFSTEHSGKQNWKLFQSVTQFSDLENKRNENKNHSNEF